MEPHDVVLNAYRRILRNAEKGTGTRLTAEETEAIAWYDATVSAAVASEDDRLKEAGATDG